jgi:hypothetical protein
VEGEESKRKKNRNEEPPALYSRDDSPAGLHSRAEERARWSFPAPARARASHPPPPRNRPQCAARSRAREKRTLAAFLPSRAAASLLAAAGRARRRAKAANTRACSPWAQGPLRPPSQTHPKSICSPSPEPWVSNCIHQACLEAPTISKSSLRTPKSPRPSRSRQTPRVTSRHTFT